ncbi:MAG: cytochrome b/b6 domain-containing protein [Calditrichaeota bacterium]|nr:cytochrome b/b6 domain-containing protein [Calditrichota bacterium]MCB9367069.1 cytochrome b/b6 domain-containing protein [Calditrichota bacterium]MCB9391447.1 cytochrome b/b6 domain-containing protein [Calditrichota bacterium]
MNRALLTFLLCALASLPSFAGDDNVCVDCHSDGTLTRTNPDGSVVSLAVTSDSLARSKHAALACVDCHADLKDFDDWPHDEKLNSVNCAACHKDAASQVAMGGHEGVLKCASCHGTHDIRGAAPGTKLSAERVDRTCEECHNRMHPPRRGRSTGYASYDVGIHGRLQKQGKEGLPSCTGCHGSHAVHAEDRQPETLEAACLNCHGDIKEEFKKSVHGQFKEGRNLSHCFDCHGEHRSRAPSDSTLRITNESPAEATCGMCHEETVRLYNQSLHAYALGSGSPRAPRCESCHGAHNIRKVSDPESPMHRSKQVETCAKCHSQIGIALDPEVRLPRSFENYLESTHGKKLKEGNEEVPVCINCHGGHAVKGSNNPESTISLHNIDKTCGKCHTEEQKLYHESIHYRALMSGIDDSPTCTGCHGEHLLISPKDPLSKVSHNRLASETCGKCHENPDIIRKYGLDPNVVTTYTDSYHGLATHANDKNTATCNDCHGSHDVRTSADSLSSIYPGNLVQTCAKCHPKADVNFSQSYTHRALQPTEGGAQWWIARIYWIMIIVVIGGMILHNVIILHYHMMQARKHQSKGPKVTRFDRHQLIQHMALSITFILLAVTGFALKFPDAWWVKLLSMIGLDEGIRSVLHRIMAVGLIGCSVYHVVYLFMTRRGKEELEALLPAKSDISELTDNVAFHMNKRKEPPKFDRYDYSQKAEYWALIWGTILMIATGFVLWFPAQLSPILPAWAVPVSQTIHLYEAWLATLAIIVWHFFFVIFHPEEYPMSWTWLTGKMSLDFVKHHHRRWYDKLNADGKAAPSEGVTQNETESNSTEK